MADINHRPIDGARPVSAADTATADRTEPGLAHGTLDPRDAVIPNWNVQELTPRLRD
jgi:hypothetical protein